MKKVFITGADGFIGSHLTELLVKSGYDVRVLVQYNSFSKWGWIDTLPVEVINSIEIIPGDIRDPFLIEKSLLGIDIVMHLAALIAIPYSYKSPNEYISTNVTGTLNVLQAALRNQTPMIHTSTSEVYGSAQYVPINETHPLNAQSPYAASKIAADQLALSYHRSFDLPVAIIRPFNTFGPRQSARAVIPTIITQIASGKKSIHLGALSPTRDFTYVSDTVNAFLQMSKHMNKAIGQTINLGTGYEISIEDLANEIASVFNVNIEITSNENRLRPEKSEVSRLCSDNTLARKLISWFPEYHGKLGMREALEITSNWFQEDINLKQYKPDMFNV